MSQGGDLLGRQAPELDGGGGDGGHALIDCSIKPALGPSKAVYISYINENPWHFGKPASARVLPLLMGLKTLNRYLRPRLRGSRLICIRIDEPESPPE